MITFATCFFQPENVRRYSRCYDSSWVDRLARGIRRNYANEHRIVCLHDGSCEPTEPVELVELIHANGYGNFIETWRSDIADGPVAVFGLDTVFTGDITKIIDSSPEVGVNLDPQAGKLCMGCAVFSRETADMLWKTFDSDRPYWTEKATLDGILRETRYLRALQAMGRISPKFMNMEFPGQILSYRQIRRGADRSDCRIAWFQRSPKPHNCNDPWILKHWK